jgi:integrase
MDFMDGIGASAVADLSKVGERIKLKPKAGDEPHWQRLRAGCFLGYRPSRLGGKGNWFARAFNQDAGKYQRRPLGGYGDLAGNEVFAAAKRDAEIWCDRVESGGIAAEKLETVADACRAYLKAKPGSIAEGVFRRQVFDDPIARVKLDKVRRHHLLAWRQRLTETPALISRSKKGQRRFKDRSASTINRDMVPLRAALGRVLSPGAPKTDAAWQEALRPISGADKRRDVYLDLQERKRLLDAMPAEAVPFVRGLCTLPLRPGALAALQVKDFDKRTATLTIGKDKHGRPRQIVLPQSSATFIGEQVKGKLPGAWMFCRVQGQQWDKDAWKHPIKEAVGSAGVPAAVSAYTLRHSVLTDLIRQGLPILTVAQISGTSVAMIEKHYGHLGKKDAADALASIAI